MIQNNFFLFTGQSLDVQILVDPPGVQHQASSALNLTCIVSGQANVPLTYHWTSNCDRNCFVLGNEDGTLFSNAIHSVDAGNHTCVITDVYGNNGSATAEIVVQGIYT